MDRICRWCSSIPSNSSLFCSFWSIFFSRASSYWALPLLPFPIDACFALLNSFIGGYASWTPFCTEKGHFLVLLAWSRPSSLTIHSLCINDWDMHTQLFKSCKMTPLWINSELIHFPSYTVYIQYMEIPCTVLANPTYIHTVYDRVFGGFPAKNTVYTPCM